MGRAARFPYRFLLPLAFLGVLFSSSYGASGDDNSCVGCHTELGDEYVVPVHGWRESTHASAGVTCEQCHGGNPSSWDVEEAMSEAKGFVGRPVGAEIVMICGTCHADTERMRPYGIRTDQLSFYKTSQHGQAVLERGSTDAATCIDCHGSHRILPPAHPKSLVHHGNVPETCAKCHADEAKMSKYGLPTDALAEYKESYHGVLLYRDDNPLVPDCATCHGVHGATPPGVEDVSQVCGNCHGNTAENYAKSPHERARHFYGSPRCVDCHGNHRIRFPSRELFAAEDGCASCHADDRGAEVARAFYQELDHTATSLKEAKASLEDAPARLIYLDPYLERLREADTRLIEAGPVSHALDLEALKKITSEATAVAEEVHHTIEEKKRELAVRKGAWFVVAFVAVLWVVFLILKLRQIPNPYEGPQSTKNER